MSRELLADHVDLLTGFPFKSSSYTDDDADAVRLVRGDNIVQGGLRWTNAARWPSSMTLGLDQYFLQPGDVVLAMDRPWIDAGLKFARIDDEDSPSLLVQRVARLRALSSLDQRFLFYLVGSRSFTDHVLSIQTGTAVPHISGGQILQFQFQRPTLPEQQAIAEVLGALDDKIEQNRRTAQALERLARAIFRAWFVDFEPVKAKAAGATSFPSMPQTAFDSLPRVLTTTDIGLLPEDWSTCAFEQLAQLHKSHINPQQHLQELFAHFSIPAYDSKQGPSYESGQMIKSSKFLMPGECILISKLNPKVPRVWLANKDQGRRQIASTEFLVLSPRSKEDRFYLYCQLLEPVFNDRFAQPASGTSNSHQRVKPADLMQTKVACPPETIRAAFAQVAAPLFSLIEAQRQESTNLAVLRDYLLPRLLEGKLRISATHSGELKVR